MPLNQQAEKGVTVLTYVTEPDYQREIGRRLHNGGKEEYVGTLGDSLGCFKILPCPVIKINGKRPLPNPGRTMNGSDPSGMKVWATLL